MGNFRNDMNFQRKWLSNRNIATWLGDRTSWLSTVILPILFLGIICSCELKDDARVVKIGLSHSKSHSFTQALERFGTLVEKQTNGRYKVKVYNSSQIGSEKEMQEMLTVGSLEMTVTGLLNSYEPLFAVLELPYLYTDRAHVVRVMESATVERVAKSLTANGVRLFGFYENGFRQITNSKRAINKPSDMKGLMIRVPENPAQVQTFKALGAIPTPLSFSELYTALVQGVVDGQENPLQNIWYGRLYEAQPHIAMTSHIYNSAYVLIGNDFYESLAETDKRIFRDCMKSSIAWQLNYMEENDNNLVEKLKEEGMHFTYPDKLAFKNATLPAYEAIYESLGNEAREIVEYIKGDTTPATSRKVFYINSYHKGYKPSDDVLKGIHSFFKNKDVLIEDFFMDTKRNNTEEHTQKVVKQVLEKIDHFRPDVIIASDDNAVKEVVVPYFRNGPIPVVFCGVNWSASEYNLPSENVTGMLEVLPLPELIDTTLKYFPESKKLTVLSEKTLSEEKNKQLLDTLFRNKGLTTKYIFVDEFDDWKLAFIDANNNADLIYLPTNGAIKGWNDEEAISFVGENIKKPVVTCDDFMMNFSVLGLTKVAEEQGEWAALNAWKILQGHDVSEIPLAKNQKYEAWLNAKFADKIGFQPSEKLKAISKVL